MTSYSERLKDYQPADTLESAHLAVHRECWAHGEIGSERPDRHLTASAYVLDPASQRVLVLWHAKLERWLQPGGHLEAGEDPMRAAARELLEEAGLALAPCDGILDLDVHRIPGNARRPAHDHVDVRFLFRAETSELPPSPEGTPLRWCAIAELGKDNPQDTGMERIASKLSLIAANP